MNYSDIIRNLWMEVNEVSGPIADLRDLYINVKPKIHPRFSQLDKVWRNLNNLEQGLFEFQQIKPPIFGKKPEHEVLLIAQGSLENARILLTMAAEEYERMYAPSTEEKTAQDNTPPMTAARAEELAELAAHLMEAEADFVQAMKNPDHGKKNNAPNK